MIERIIVEQARESDTDVVASILLEAANWLISRGMPLWSPDEFLPEKLRDQVSDGKFWLLKIGDIPAGCVCFQLEDQLNWPDVPAHESAFIHKLAVCREYAGGRISSALLKWAKEHTRQCGRKYLRLDCAADRTKLCHPYENNGFRKHSETYVGPYHIARYEYEVL